MPTAVGYTKRYFNKLRRFFRSDYVYEFRLCKGGNGSKGTYCIIHIRNILAFIVLLTILGTYWGSKYHEQEFAKHIPESKLSYLKFKDIKYRTLNISDVKRLINEYNTNETILNKCSFEAIKWNTIIFVVHVEKLTFSLKHFIVSLSQVRGIEEALLIFSHSHYDINLNRFIRNIDFVRVQQIFYPYSLEVNPSTFPGLEPNDCAHTADVKKALAKNCTGALTPDVRGFFRDPEKAQQKHHWWWTANKVFEDLKFSDTHEGLVFFLDEDLFILEDALYLAIYMRGVVGALPHCEFFSLSRPLDQSTYDKSNIAKLEVLEWTPELHSGALGFDMDTWNKIVANYDIFCNIDEYSWTKSLFEISKRVNGGIERFKVITSVVPRAYKISYHGLFENVNRRMIFENSYAVMKMQRNAEEKLFPPTFKIHISNDTTKDDDSKEDILSGGWNDPRDKNFCIKMTIRKIKKVFFKMAEYYD